ncbi:hypothetical protein MPHASIOC01_004367 [Mangrovibacter phragmitis]
MMFAESARADRWLYL